MGYGPGYGTGNGVGCGAEYGEFCCGKFEMGGNGLGGGTYDSSMITLLPVLNESGVRIKPLCAWGP